MEGEGRGQREGGDQTWATLSRGVAGAIDTGVIRRVSLLQLRRVHSDLAPSHPCPLCRRGPHTLLTWVLREGRDFSGRGSSVLQCWRSDPSTEQNRKKDVGLSQ